MDQLPVENKIDDYWNPQLHKDGSLMFSQLTEKRSKIRFSAPRIVDIADL